MNTSVDHVAFVRVEGVDAAAANDFEAYLFDTDADVPLTWAALEERLTTVAGGGRYGSLGYDLVESEGQAGAAVVVREKPHGPPFLNVAVALENEGEDLALRLGTRFTAYDVWVRDAEARVDVELGTDVGVQAEYLLPLARSPWFIAPSVALQRATRSFGGGQDPLASYRIQRARAGLDLGVTLGTRSELRVGYRAGSLDAKGRRVTTSPLPRLQGGGIDVGAWVESGSAFQTREDADIHSDLSGGLLIDTVIGALLVSGSVGDDGSPAFYVALGRPFW